MGKRKNYPLYEEAQKTVQEAGIKTMGDYSLKYKEFGLPSDPRTYYKASGWINWDSFLGKLEQFISYEEAQKIVQEMGVHSRREYDLVYKENGLPSAPDRTYKDKGWIDWDSFLGKTKHKLSYDEAKEIVQEKGIKDKEEYLLVYNKLGLPKNPNKTYNGKGWIKWDYFLGKYHTFQEAKVILKESGIKSKRQYELSHTKLGLPSDPRTYYKEEGWTSWSNLWRELYGKTTKDRKYNVLKRLSISPDLLKDDAPLKVIYILASKLNQELAKEIELLLGTSSYEERLNWVKKQLKGLKDGSPSKTKTTGVVSISELTPAVPSGDYDDSDDDEWFFTDDFSEKDSEETLDELSSMESIKDELYDEKVTLSEDEAEDLNVVWENYVHNAVNRELIAEHDG